MSPDAIMEICSFAHNPTIGLEVIHLECHFSYITASSSHQRLFCRQWKAVWHFPCGNFTGLFRYVLYLIFEGHFTVRCNVCIPLRSLGQQLSETGEGSHLLLSCHGGLWKNKQTGNSKSFVFYSNLFKFPSFQWCVVHLRMQVLSLCKERGQWERA